MIRVGTGRMGDRNWGVGKQLREEKRWAQGERRWDSMRKGDGNPRKRERSPGGKGVGTQEERVSEPGRKGLETPEERGREPQRKWG